MVNPRFQSSTPSYRRCSLPLIASCIITLFVTGSLYQVGSERWRQAWTSSPAPIIDQTSSKAASSSWAGSQNEHPKIEQERDRWKERAEEVKSSFVHAWNHYEEHAWGADELRPISSTPNQNYYGWGVTIVDSLDTLLLMDLQPQFAKAMDHVEKMDFQMGKYATASFFETVIRYVGGLLSAYSLLEDNGATSGVSWTFDSHNETSWTRERILQVLLDKVDKLATALMPAFKTRSGLPMYGINTVTGQRSPSNWAKGPLLAEIASCQMEFKYLAHVTGKRSYFSAVDKVIDALHKVQQNQLNASSPLGGMLPTYYSVDTAQPIDDYISLGTLADSGYEYLLKGYLLSGRSERRLLDMYLAAVNTALHRLVFVTPNRNLTYVTDRSGASEPSHRQEHLSCFFPGLLALGAGSLSTSTSEIALDVSVRHHVTAEALAETCYATYGDTATNLGPEEVQFSRNYARSWGDVLDEWMADPNKGEKPRGVHGSNEALFATKMDYAVDKRHWPMRPETIESLFLLFRLTGDPVWRERCYDIYQGMEKHSRFEKGFASVLNTNDASEVEPGVPNYFYLLRRKLEDSMPSWALAETFKYLYLCMMDPRDSAKLLPPDKWIFNTEAHPLKVFDWSETEIDEWSIRT